MPFDYPNDKKRAEAVLRYLCVGAQIAGIRFGGIPQLLITDYASGKPRVRGQLYLNLASEWRVWRSRPATFPREGLALEELPEAEALQQIVDIRELVITEVELGEDAPDLLFTLEDGRVFFLIGRDEYYEAWDFGIAYAPEGSALVVACPGNQVAVWDIPESAIVSPAI